MCVDEKKIPSCGFLGSAEVEGKMTADGVTNQGAEIEITVHYLLWNTNYL